MHTLSVGPLTLSGGQVLQIVAILLLAILVAQLIVLARALNKKRRGNEKWVTAPILVTLLGVLTCAGVIKFVYSTVSDVNFFSDEATVWFGSLLFPALGLALYPMLFLLTCVVRSFLRWRAGRKRARLKKKKARQQEHEQY